MNNVSVIIQTAIRIDKCLNIEKSLFKLGMKNNPTLNKVLKIIETKNSNKHLFETSSINLVSLQFEKLPELEHQ